LNQIDQKIQYRGTVQVNASIQIDDPEQVIASIASHLRTYGFPPGRRFEALFVFTFQTWTSSPNLAFGRWAGEVMKAIHSIPNQASRLLAFYQEVARNSSLGIQADILQSSYLNFRRLAKGQFSTEPPVSLLDHTIGDVSSDVEKAFEWLTKWETAFDGVRLLWNVVLNNPDCNFQAQFDKLLYSQKQFVIEGFRVSSREQEGGVGDEIPELIADLDRRALKPRVNVEAEIEKVSGKARDVPALSRSAVVQRPKGSPRRRGPGSPSDEAGND
jgi:hypothetical protein